VEVKEHKIYDNNRVIALSKFKFPWNKGRDGILSVKFKEFSTKMTMSK